MKCYIDYIVEVMSIVEEPDATTRLTLETA